MAFAALTIDLNARLAKFEQDMQRAGKSLDGLNSRASAAAAGLKTAFGALASTLTVGALASFAKSGIDAADALNDMSQRLGVSVKDLASFKLAAEQSGTSLDSVGAGIARLSKSIGEAENGNKKLAETLARLGITAKDPKEAFFQLADAVQKIEDPSQRAALLSQVLGKKYGELVPLLNQGSAALRESAKSSETFADAMARLAPEADRLNDHLALLKNNAAGAAATILSKLVPSFNEWIAVGREVVKTGSLLDKVRFFALGNASDEMVGRVRKMAAATEAASKRARASIGNIEKPDKSTGTKSTGTKRAISTRSPTDPLASLLSQTDTAKAAEYEKLQGLLNARFARGAVSGKQYAEAMSALRNSYFSEELKAYKDNLDAVAESEAAVAEHFKKTEDQLREQNQAWVDAGAAINEEYKPGLEKLEDRLEYLNELFRRNVISVDALSAATADAFDSIGKSTDTASKGMDSFAKTAAENIQNSFADFLFDPFDKGMKGMLQSFGQTIQRMIADAVAADLAKSLFGDLVKGGSGSGMVGSVLSGIGSLFGFANGGIAAYGRPVAIPRFAGGGVSNTAAIFGEAGPEAAVPLPDGRSIPVKMMGGSSRPNITVIVQGGSAPDVRRAAGQGAREALGMLEGARRYG